MVAYDDGEEIATEGPSFPVSIPKRLAIQSRRSIATRSKDIRTAHPPQYSRHRQCSPKLLISRSDRLPTFPALADVAVGFSPPALQSLAGRIHIGHEIDYLDTRL